MTQFISPNDIAKEYGGEPLLNMSFIKKIVSYVDKLDLPHKNLKFSMTTNAMLLEKNTKKACSNHFKQAFYFLVNNLSVYLPNLSVNFLMICLASPTIPKSATWKIGACLSLFTAIIKSESSIPATCWIAPEIPNAK